MPNRAIAALLLLAIGIAPRAASACSMLGPTEFAPTAPTGSDEVAPALDGPVDVLSHRGEFIGLGSCADLGFVELTFFPAEEGQPLAVDDAASDAEWPGVGYRLTLLEGSLPEGLTLADAPVYAARSEDRARLGIHWIDGTFAVQDPLDVTLGIIAVDAAGNESEPLEVEVGDVAECSAAGARPAAGMWMLVMAAMALRRRSRRGPGR